jgi:hypothetical protein
MSDEGDGLEDVSRRSGHFLGMADIFEYLLARFKSSWVSMVKQSKHALNQSKHALKQSKHT